MRTAYIFPGQGSQYVGMGKDLVNKSEIAALTFEEADKALGFKISEICFNGPDEVLKRTAYTQPAILTLSIAILRMLEDNGLYPQVAAGHSLGEYSALVAAKVIDFKDAVRLVHHRGKLMEKAFAPGEGTMAAVMGVDESSVKLLCQEAASEGVIEPANFNCPGQIVIAGTQKAINKAIEIGKNYGAKRILPLNVSGPFHSSLMSSAAEKFCDFLQDIEFKKTMFPVVANINAEPLQNPEDIKNALIKQIASPVLWEQSIRTIFKMGISTFVEVGPGKVLTGLLKKIEPFAQGIETDNEESLRKCIALLKECR